MASGVGWEPRAVNFHPSVCAADLTEFEMVVQVGSRT